MRVDNLRKRTERGKLLSEVLFLFAIVGFIYGSAWFISNLNGGFVCETRAITVQAGDTLDEIVRDHCEGEVTRALDNVVRVYGATIQPNQTIYLPKNEKCLVDVVGDDVYDEC